MEAVASTLRKATIIYQMHLFCLPTPFNVAVYNCLFYKFLIAFLKKKCVFYWCNTFKVHANSLR